MLVKIMMWASIVVVLLALLELPVMGGTILVETVLCVSGLLVSCQAFRSGQYVLAIGFLPIISHPLPRPAGPLFGLAGSALQRSWLRLWS
ncbi:MAG: hypothetical protein DMG19_19590 [Acidobacteria bacterium]|nr:MAG: hypothetical protein DMG19_19590 [Acidobacteriota bacterium]